MREMAKMMVVLTIIALISGGGLGFLERYTREPIEYQKLKFVKGPAVLAVLSGCENDPIGDYKKGVTVAGEGDEAVKKTLFPAKKDGSVFAVAYEIAAQGYHGDMGFMIGVEMKTGRITGLRVMTHTETPGLGARATEPAFYEQFAGAGLDNLALADKGGKIDAISGATITSQGVVTGVREGLELFERSKEKIEKALEAG